MRDHQKTTPLPGNAMVCPSKGKSLRQSVPAETEMPESAGAGHRCAGTPCFSQHLRLFGTQIDLLHRHASFRCHVNEASQRTQAFILCMRHENVKRATKTKRPVAYHHCTSNIPACTGPLKDFPPPPPAPSGRQCPGHRCRGRCMSLTYAQDAPLLEMLYGDD